jgi:DNA-directed RNA polymerase subunit RPC12/RpoP
MASSCPECGAGVELSTATAKVLTGTCAACGQGFTVLAAVQPPTGAPASRGKGDVDEAEAEEEGAASTIACADCGEMVAVENPSEGRIETVCPGCGARAAYSLVGGPTEVREERYRGRPRDDARAGPRGRDTGPRPPGRPCRECGGTLRFTTAPDGTVTGECTSCGNRFTLRPRSDSEGRGGGRGFSGPSRGSYGRPGGWGRGGSGSYRGRDRGPPRPSYRRRDDSDDDRDRRRRRPRRE